MGLSPQNRIAALEEAAIVILFLASDEASYITDAKLPADGGFTVCWFSRQVFCLKVEDIQIKMR